VKFTGNEIFFLLNFKFKPEPERIIMIINDSVHDDDDDHDGELQVQVEPKKNLPLASSNLSSLTHVASGHCWPGALATTLAGSAGESAQLQHCCCSSGTGKPQVNLKLEVQVGLRLFESACQ
jgi:hypothetical protein